MPRPAGVASLEGALSLVTRDGDIERGGGNTVYLLREASTLHSSVSDICARYGARLLQLDYEFMSAGQDTVDAGPGRTLEQDARLRSERLNALNAKKASLVGEVDQALKAVLSRHEVARVRSGTDGRYRFAQVNPGIYRLYAVTIVDESPYTWWITVGIARGERARLDLDNAVETLAGGPSAGLCGPLPRRAPSAPRNP